MRLWRAGRWESRVLRGHAASVDGVAFAPDGRHVVSGARDGTLRVWELGRDEDLSAERLRERMAAMTSALIEAGGRASTPQPTL